MKSHLHDPLEHRRVKLIRRKMVCSTAFIRKLFLVLSCIARRACTVDDALVWRKFFVQRSSEIRMMAHAAWQYASKRMLAATACTSLAFPALSASMCSAAGEDASLAEKSRASAVQVRPELHAAAKLDLDRVQDWESFREHGHKMVDFIADYYKTVHTRPVKAQVEPGYLQKCLPQAAPDKPESFDAVMHDVTQHIMPGVTHWQHPGFLAYFPANTSVPGLLGDMLSGMFNVIGFSWVASPACTELEGVVMDWLHDLLGLPAHFHSSGAGGGVIQGTASEATAVALLAALSRAHARRPEGTTQQEWASKFVVYTSDQAHSSVKKAAMVAGVPPGQFRALPASSAAPPACLADSGFTDRNFSLQGSTLRSAVEEDLAKGLVPVFACGTLGSTSTGAFDDLKGLGKVCKDVCSISVSFACIAALVKPRTHDCCTFFTV